MNFCNVWLNDNLSSKPLFKVKSRQSSTALSLLAALGLSACGAGGSKTSPTNNSNSNSTTSNDNNVTLPSDTIDNTLTLTRSGTDYSTSTMAGFSLLGTDSHYQVADATSNAYSVTLSASGAGMLTFEFVDADDVVTLESGSTVSGFSQMKVIRGTVDVSEADLGSITYVSVASSVKLTAAQVLDLDTIVIDAASGNVEVVVTTKAEIDQISNALSNGTLNLFSPENNLMTLEAAPGASVTTAEINAGQNSFNSEKRPLSEVDEEATDDTSTSSTTSSGSTASSGGGGSTSGGSSGTTTSSNTLTLTRSGTDYSTSTMAGFSLLGTDSHYQVADATSNAYSVTLSASGAGMLTFEFVDADDVVTLESGSTVSGFSQMKVIRGTVDVSEADLGSITYVSVASSVKLTAAQVLDLDTIVIDAASGNVEVVVTTKAEIDQISNALSNGTLNLFSPENNLMTLEAAPGASVTTAEINAGQNSFNSEKRPLSEVDEAVIISIQNSSGGLTTEERSSDVSVTVVPDAGATVVSARVDGVDVGSISNNAFNFAAAGLSSGFHTLSVTTQNSSNVQTVTQQEFLVVGLSNVGSDIFEFKSSKVGDVITLEAYVKNLHYSLADGIRSYDFWLDFDESKFDYVEGSFTPASGTTNAGAENTVNGEVFANGYFQAPWTAYDNAFFTVQARSLANDQSLLLEFVDFNIYRTDFGTFTNSIDV